MLRIQIRQRHHVAAWRPPAVLAAALLLALAVSAGLLTLQGTHPLAGMKALLQGAFGSRWALEDAAIKAVPIFLCSLGVAVAFRLQIWNIGAEGQYAFGALGATWVALSLPTLPGFALLPLMFAGAAAGGALWGMIPALLRVHLRANEIIVTLMFNYLAIFFLQYLVYGAWKDPRSFGFPMTELFAPGAVVGKIGSTNLNWGLLVCLLAGLAFWIFFRHTRMGYDIAAAGENVRAARYAGLPYDRMVVLVMALSGALAGWAGLLEASATIGRLQPSIMVGYGYTAIVVAWLARLHPLQIALTAYLLAGLRVGVENLQLDYQVPAAFGSILEGLILLTVLGSAFFNRYRLTLQSRQAP